MDTAQPYAPPTDSPASPRPHVDLEKVAYIRDLFQRARSHRRPMLDKWTSNYEILHNDVWAPNRPAWLPSPRVAEIFPTIASLVAWESDASPTYDITPYADPNSPHHATLDEQARDLRTALKAAWLINDYDAEIQKILWDGKTYGTGISKAVWDPHAHRGQGDATLRRVDPFWFYPDPDATNIDNGRFYIECYELSDDELEERFPGALAKVGAGSSEDIDRSPTQLDSSSGSRPKANTRPISPATNSSFSRPGQIHSHGDSIDSTRHTIIECWHRCECGESAFDQRVKEQQAKEREAEAAGMDVESVEALRRLADDLNGSPDEPPPVDPMADPTADPMAAPPVDPTADPMDPAALEAAFQTEPAPQPTPEPTDFTPTSHWHCTAITSNTVLIDVPVDRIWSHGRHPFDRFVPIDQGEFWGVSMVELLAPVQHSINRLLSAIEQNIWLAGNPVFKEDSRSGLQRTKITNKPGQRLTVAANSQAEWLNPPQIHPQLAMQLVTFYVDQIERISGLSAVVRGATPTGRNAQGVLDSVQEAAFVRTRLALRNLEAMLRNSGQKIASLIAEFYDTPRVVATVGPTGEKSVTQLQAQHFYTPDSSGTPTPMEFQLSIQAGSTLSTSRAARIAEADTLFAMGAIDEEALLIAHDFPNWPIVAARVREMKAAMGMGPQPSARAAAGRTQ